MTAVTSTFTPLEEMRYPNKKVLADEFVGRKLSELRTPACIIDRRAFKTNCEVMVEQTHDKGMNFRAHIKTHKTPDGTRLQVEAGPGVSSLVTSTLPEVWGVLESGLVADGKVVDILYSLPVGEGVIEDLNAAQEKAGNKCSIRVMVDHPLQIAALQRWHKRLNRRKPWSVFVKVDGGGKRAGAPPRSAQMKALIEEIAKTPQVEIFGFYSHFGQSYQSRSLDKAGEFYAGEIECVNDAAAFARTLGVSGDWILSVGATPTAHAAVLGAGGKDASGAALNGTLELHAGCYCLNDLQQLATGMITGPRKNALSVLATVVSSYADRGEALCDSGALAMSKDTGPSPSFGHVVSKGHEGWILGGVSQEHGILRRDQDAKQVAELSIGDKLRIVPNHACLCCACFPWFYIVDGNGDEVVDVWVPWKGW